MFYLFPLRFSGGLWLRLQTPWYFSVRKKNSLAPLHFQTYFSMQNLLSDATTSLPLRARAPVVSARGITCISLYLARYVFWYLAFRHDMLYVRGSRYQVEAWPLLFGLLFPIRILRLMPLAGPVFCFSSCSSCWSNPFLSRPHCSAPDLTEIFGRRVLFGAIFLSPLLSDLCVPCYLCCVRFVYLGFEFSSPGLYSVRTWQAPF